MKNNRIIKLSLVLAAIFTVFAPLSNAAETPKTYGEAVGDKSVRSIVNIVSAPLEIPKNMINVIFY